MQFLKQIYGEEAREIFAEKQPRLVFIQNQSNEECIFSSFVAADTQRQYPLSPKQSRLLWIYKAIVKLPVENSTTFEINLMQLTKLQAFIDIVFSMTSCCCVKYPFVDVFSVPALVTEPTAQKVEYWYTSQIDHIDLAHQAIIPFIRSTEAYQLTSFLIKENSSGEKSVRYLSQKYGLSNSYFRSLCKQVLGRAVKEEIRNWRLANALIDMTKQQLSATDIAYRAGYSSLSHFSKEVKKTLGCSTRSLKKQILF